MSDPLKRRRGRPKGSGDRDGLALRQIFALCTADKALSRTAAIKLVIVNKQLVKNGADPINNVRRLRYKSRLVVQALHLGPDEEEPFDPARHANAENGKRTWMNSQDANLWEEAGRAGWTIEQGWFGNREYVCKIRRDLLGVLIREDDPAEVALYLERFMQIGFRFRVGIDGEVSVDPPGDRRSWSGHHCKCRAFDLIPAYCRRRQTATATPRHTEKRHDRAQAKAETADRT